MNRLNTAKNRLIVALGMACVIALGVAVVGCQPPPPQPIIDIRGVVTCAHCRGVHSDKCPRCVGHPHEPKWWR